MVVTWFLCAIIAFQVGIMYRFMELEDEAVNLTGEWYFKVTDVTKEAIVFILIPFGIKNLVRHERTQSDRWDTCPVLGHLNAPKRVCMPRCRLTVYSAPDPCP